MADRPVKTFIVNGRTYSLGVMPPDVAFGFGLRVSRVIGPMLKGLSNLKDLSDKDQQGKMLAMLSESISGLDTEKAEVVCKEAMDYVVNPDNESMSNAAYRGKWFIDHPEDIMAVPIRAVMELAKDFLLPTLTTLIPNSV